jgi:membrane protein DedA with SNARE-associated domain
MLTDLSNLLLSSLVVYGLPLIFGIVLVASLGVPLPATLVLLTAGALVQQQLLSMTWVLVACLVATVGGDHLGYWLGWWGGRPLIKRMGQLIGGEVGVQRSLEATERWGWWAIFFTRWLVTPLGAPCSWACGMIEYPLHHFFLADVLGEAIYVVILVYIGDIFADHLEDVSDLITSVGPWLLGVLVLVIVIYLLLKSPSTPPSGGEQLKTDRK